MGRGGEMVRGPYLGRGMDDWDLDNVRPGLQCGHQLLLCHNRVAPAKLQISTQRSLPSIFSSVFAEMCRISMGGRVEEDNVLVNGHLGDKRQHVRIPGLHDFTCATEVRLKCRRTL